MDISSNPADLLAVSGERTGEVAQDERYVEAIQLHGPALTRLARGYESEPERRQDLLQDIHVALWRSFAVFDGRCSLRTWIYRIAHHTATKHIVANRRVRLQEMHTLDELPEPEDPQDGSNAADQDDSLQHLLQLIGRLKPLDRQVILLYLEDFSAEASVRSSACHPTTSPPRFIVSRSCWLQCFMREATDESAARGG